MPTHGALARKITLAVILSIAPAAVPGTAVAQSGTAAPVTELPELLEQFLVPAESVPGAVLPWDAGAGPSSRVRWATGAVAAEAHQRREGFELQRVGLVVISAAGEPAYRTLHRGRMLPGAWRITLLGQRAGAARVDISSEGDTEGTTMDVPQLLSAAGWAVTPFRCSRETEPAIYGRVAHVVEAPGRRPAWLQESWDYGALTGLRVALTLLYSEEDADRIECVSG